MMNLFLSNPNKVFTRDHLIESIWGFNVSTEDRTIDSHVRNLREKLRKAGFSADVHLQAINGVDKLKIWKISHPLHLQTNKFHQISAQSLQIIALR